MTLATSSLSHNQALHPSPLSVDPVSGALVLRSAPTVSVKVVGAGSSVVGIVLALALGFALWRMA